MKTLEIQATVDADGELRVVAQAPPGIAKPPLRLKMLDLRGLPANTTFRREDIYGDDGR
ncbi:MAG TPA: hypothetical protein VFE33_11550 [Thermoanaerobaculia bacterium]|nr:hypothetical protein [Thermoanaerobaculia bacterium]